jgi:hypothetical protein
MKTRQIKKERRKEREKDIYTDSLCACENDRQNEI